jgi:hypothetical protein
MAQPHHAGIVSSLHTKRVEPRKRFVAGTYGWAIHRHPLKDGISLQDALNRDMGSPCFLLRKLGEHQLDHVRDH